jgi:glycosyltransferase involved in cell wall biosynthesis
MSNTVAVIIPVYNDWMYLVRALESVASQTRLPEEIIVVDDGSPYEGIDEICKDFQGRSGLEIKYLRKPNGGAASARNYGLKRCDTDYVCFLDVDDFWLPKNIEGKMSILESLPNNYFGVYGQYTFSDSGRMTTFDMHDGVLPIDKVGEKNGFPGGAPAYIFTRESLTSVDGFDEGLKVNEDFDLLIRLVRKGYLCKGVNFSGFVRVMREGSLTRNEDVYALHERISRFLDKAEVQGYFSNDILLRKRKQNDLMLAARLHSKGESHASVLAALTAAFKWAGPSSLKELLAYFYCFSLRVKEKLK